MGIAAVFASGACGKIVAFDGGAWCRAVGESDRAEACRVYTVA